MNLNVNLEFEPGDLVTFKAMQTLELSAGRPQAFSVVTSVIWYTKAVVEPCYYCRAIGSNSISWEKFPNRSRQDVKGCIATLTGLFLFHEEELTEYEIPKEIQP